MRYKESHDVVISVAKYFEFHCDRLWYLKRII